MSKTEIGIVVFLVIIGLGISFYFIAQPQIVTETTTYIQPTRTIALYKDGDKPVQELLTNAWKELQNGGGEAGEQKDVETSRRVIFFWDEHVAVNTIVTYDIPLLVIDVRDNFRTTQAIDYFPSWMVDAKFSYSLTTTNGSFITQDFTNEQSN